MLRGLDARGAAADYEPTIVKVAGRSAVAGSVTVYVEGAPTPATHRRLRRVCERLEFFSEAGIVPTPKVVSWSADGTDPTEGAAPKTAAVYEEFREAVGPEALDPFFERGADGTLSPPDICIAFRREGQLSGLYPRIGDGHVRTVEECLTALAAGNDVDNVER